MLTWKWLRGELAMAEHLIGCGNAERALERLGFLLLQYDGQSQQFGHHQASILHLMAKAATSLGNQDLAEGFYLRGIKLLEDSDTVAPAERADFLISLAEHFASKSMFNEALSFADGALDVLRKASQEFERDESAELLRRYAWVADTGGLFPAAYLALSLGLLVLHEASGMESDIAESLATLVERVCAVDSPKAIQQIGSHVVSNLKRGMSASVFQ